MSHDPSEPQPYAGDVEAQRQAERSRNLGAASRSDRAAGELFPELAPPAPPRPVHQGDLFPGGVPQLRYAVPRAGRCWLCNKVGEVVGTCVVGDACAECFGDGSPIQMGPRVSTPTQQWRYAGDEEENDDKRLDMRYARAQPRGTASPGP